MGPSQELEAGKQQALRDMGFIFREPSRFLFEEVHQVASPLPLLLLNPPHSPRMRHQAGLDCLRPTRILWNTIGQ